MLKNNSFEDLFTSLTSMEKFQVKGKLILDHALLFEFLSQYKECFVSCNAKSVLNLSIRSVKRDFRKALRIIDRRMPVFAELPKIVNKGNGTTQKVNAETNEPINEEYEINPLPSSSTQYIEYTSEE